MANRVFVSGYGIVSALGLNAAENLAALKAGQSGIGHAKHLQTKHRELWLGEVDQSNDDLKTKCDLDKNNVISRTTLLGLLAATEALTHSGLTGTTSIGFLNGTSVGGMDISEQAYQRYLKGENIDFSTSFGGHDCGASTEKIAAHLHLSGYQSTISTACSSSANTIMLAARLIKSGHIHAALAGGTDALSIFTLNGFNSLKILDTDWCRPFDATRAGLNLGEGAAYLAIESEEHLKARGGNAIAEIIGYGNANDAFHQTASSPEGKGAFLAMQKAMSTLGNRSIDYVNAHGTGTQNNDESESLALKRTFGNDMPPYSSTKSYTGHTLAAAGAIEAVFSLMSMEQQSHWPNLNMTIGMGVLPDPVTLLRSAKIDVVLSNSFGFGGNCSSLIYAKP